MSEVLIREAAEPEPPSTPRAGVGAADGPGGEGGLLPLDSVVEAVVISGSRRGEIVHVDLNASEVWTDEQWGMLAQALKQLDAELVGLLEDTQRLGETLREATEEMRRR